tara:strand:- start:91 stop:606 length:516 start_codon:yes stop_codon:yes gene_type:complete
VKNQDILENQVNIVYLALGSNLGNRLLNLEKAKFNLIKNGIKILNISNFYATPSWPNKNFPYYINIVIKIETKLDPYQLFNLVKQIEILLGRKINKKNHPRTCDIDIIDFNGKIINENKLKIPHKRLQQRNFVLIPLYEICRNWIHPVTGKNIINLLNNLSYSNLQSIKLI